MTHLTPPSAKRMGGEGGGQGLQAWWQLHSALDAASLEVCRRTSVKCTSNNRLLGTVERKNHDCEMWQEILSTDAPEELCDPVSLFLLARFHVQPRARVHN